MVCVYSLPGHSLFYCCRIFCLFFLSVFSKSSAIVLDDSTQNSCISILHLSVMLAHLRVITVKLMTNCTVSINHTTGFLPQNLVVLLVKLAQTVNNTGGNMIVLNLFRLKKTNKQTKTLSICYECNSNHFISFQFELNRHIYLFHTVMNGFTQTHRAEVKMTKYSFSELYPG